MERDRRVDLNASFLGLIVLNFSCAMLHFVFTAKLLEYKSIYREFLLIENTLIGFVFLMFAVGLMNAQGTIKLLIVNIQLLWWIIFLASVIIFWNAVTTLSFFNPWILFPLSESTILLITGVFAVGLCISSKRSTYAK